MIGGLLWIQRRSIFSLGSYERRIEQCCGVSRRKDDGTFFPWPHLTFPSPLYNSHQVREPNKCLGWLWVPISYLESVAASQIELTRLREAAASKGNALPVSLEKMLEAQRLAEALRSSGDVRRVEKGSRLSGEVSSQQRGFGASNLIIYS